MAIKIARRQFIATLGGTALAWPLTSQAQQVERMQRIGVLSGVNADDAEVRADIAVFRQELQQLGWTDGRNVRFDIRSAAGNATDARKYAAELVALAPDVILSVGSTSAAQLLQASHTALKAVANTSGQRSDFCLQRPRSSARISQSSGCDVRQHLILGQIG